MSEFEDRERNKVVLATVFKTYSREIRCDAIQRLPIPSSTPLTIRLPFVPPKERLLRSVCNSLASSSSSPKSNRVGELVRPGERGEASVLMNCEGLAVAIGELLTLSSNEFEFCVTILGGLKPFLDG